MSKNRFLNRLLATTIICGAAAMATPAYAQQMEDGQPEPTQGPVTNQDPEVSATGEPLQGEESTAIVVTGSRIPQPNLDSASPVTVVNSQEVKLSGTTRAEDLINSLPQAFAGQGSTIANGSTGTATLNLRNLGSVRTLVLINGRRLVPGDPTSSAADINVIPAALIQRVDVLTGGASSVYGADAVAGVVNFIMDTNFEGFRLDSQYSFYQHDNGGTRDSVITALNNSGFGYPTGSVAGGGAIDTTAVFGASFDDGRGHVTAYAGYREIDAILQDRYATSACALGAASDAAVAGGANEFSCGGSATSGVGTFFTNFATLQIGPSRTFVPGSTLYNFGPLNYFQRPDERYTLGAFAEYEISEEIQPYLEVMFMDDRTVAQIAPSGIFFNIANINCDNPLLSAQQSGIACAANNLVGFDSTAADDPTTPVNEQGTVFTDALGNQFNRGVLYIGRRNVEGGGRQDDLQHTSYRIVGGVRGDLDQTWQYDAYYQYGRTNFAQTYRNDFSVVRSGRATDVVTDPATGQPVCRSVLDGTDPNCIPYDIFAAGSVDPSALNYLQTPGLSRGVVDSRVANASVTATLGDYGIRSPWADEGIGFNAGVEYRKEALDFVSDSAFQTGDLAGQGAPTLPVSGEFSVNEVFAEARIPVISESFIHDLTFSAGYRYSDYSTGFTTDTYKFEAELAPVRDIRFRGAYNRAVRAPNIQELFAPQRVALNGSIDPCEGATPDATAAQCALTGVTAGQYGSIPANPAAQYNGLIGGNPNLNPETADTYTAGVVLQPRFVPGFALTVDYFDISVEDTISGIGQDTIITTCINTGDPTFCNLINRDARGSIWLTPQGFVRDLTQNIGSLETSGIDVQASYIYEIGAWGSIGANFVGTWLDELIVDNGVSAPYDCVGFYGNQCGVPVPEWRHTARVNYTSPDGIGLSLRWRYIDSVRQDTTSDNPTLSGTSQPAHRELDEENYFDLTSTFRVGDNYSFRLGVNNIFDNDPPVVGSQACPAGFCNGNAWSQVYDALGRYIFAGVTLDF